MLAAASVARPTQADPSPAGLSQGSFFGVFPDPVGRCEESRSRQGADSKAPRGNAPVILGDKLDSISRFWRQFIKTVANCDGICREIKLPRCFSSADLTGARARSNAGCASAKSAKFSAILQKKKRL